MPSWHLAFWGRCVREHLPTAPPVMAELLFQVVCAGKKVVEMVENAKECEEEAIQIKIRFVLSSHHGCLGTGGQFCGVLFLVGEVEAI